jgi:hypothetical protein
MGRKRVDPNEMGEATPIYHVVCRDCTNESLTLSKAEAERRASEHADAADHDVDFRKVASQTDELQVGN